MDIEIVKKLIPLGWPHSVASAEERKKICENLIQEIINQIQSEYRNPTQWELDRLSQAIKAIRSGTYTLATCEAMSIFDSKRSYISSLGDLWSPITDDLALERLNRDLAYLKGEPTRNAGG